MTQIFTILIVEDDPAFCVELEMMMDKLHYQYQSVASGEEALSLLEKNRFDIILMDIGLSGALDGLDVAERIEEEGLPIVFITAFKDQDTYDRAQQVNPVAFLVKPFDRLTLQSTMESVSRQMKSLEKASTVEERVEMEKEDFVFIKSNNKLYKLIISEIQFVEADGNYCYLHLKQRKYAVKLSLKKLSEKLPGKYFVQVHRNFLVQISVIDTMDLTQNQIYIGDTMIPIGGKYKNNMLDQLNTI